MPLSHPYRPIANGARTDHPIPDLPFVDDSLLPFDDPDGIEALGRISGSEMWGRTDPCKDGGWVAFTTDPRRPELAWVVRWHPGHGKSVVIYADADAASAYMTYEDEALLFRNGGYWWDGAMWFRPPRVFDRARERYVNRPVPAALTISAADLLGASGAVADRGRILPIGELTMPHSYAGADRSWRDDLALWAARHDGNRHPAACVVQLTAPELAADQLLTVNELAEVAGLGASTVRAYLTRGENDVPTEQATVGGRAMWSRPVAEDWAESRRRSRDGAADAMADRDRSNLSVGVAGLWDRFTQLFTHDLWENPTMRKRFALRFRTTTAVRDVANGLAWTVAASLDRIVPVHDIGATIRAAVLGEWADWQRRHPDERFSYPIPAGVTRTLDWLIQHQPTLAQGIVAEIVGDAERDLGIAPKLSGFSLRHALNLDGKLPGSAAYDTFLELALPPSD